MMLIKKIYRLNYTFYFMSKVQEKLLGQLLSESSKQTTFQQKDLSNQIYQLSALDGIKLELEKFNGSTKTAKPNKASAIVAGAFNGMGSGIKDMIQSLLLLPKVKDKHVYMFTNFVDNLLKAFERSSNINAEALDGVLNIMTNADVLATNVIKFSIKMKMAETLLPLAQKGMDKLAQMFVKFEVDLSESKLDFKKTKRVIQSLQILALGITEFSKAIALSTPLAYIGAYGFKSISAMIAGFYKVFAVIKPKTVKKGAKALKVLASGIRAFSIAMALSTPLAIIGIPGYIATTTMIAGYAALFALINIRTFQRGGRALQSLAIGLIGITGGLAFFQMAGITMKTIGMTLLAVSGLSLIMWMVSKAGASIFIGALALIALGGSLILFSIGISAIKELNLGFKDIGVVLGLVGGLAVVAGIAGVFAIPIILGSAALAILGMSLTTMSDGLKSFAELSWSDDITDNLTNAIKGLSEAFGVLGFVETASLSIKIAMLGTASSTLEQLAVGLGAFKKVGFDETDANKMQYVITSVASAFAGAGSSEGTSSSILSMFTGIDLSPNNVERGINSVMNAGAAMTSIVQGLVSWKQVYETGFTPQDFQMVDGQPVPGTVLHNIYSVLTVLKAVFAEIGMSANDGSSRIKNIFGTDFSESHVEQGIESVAKAGDVITSIAKGLMTFKSLETMGFTQADFAMVDGKPVPGGLLHNVSSVLTVIKSIFGEIGKSAKGEGSWMKNIFGSDFTESNVKMGIDSVSGASDIVINISEALKNLSTIENIDEVTQDMIGIITAFPLAALEAYNTVLHSGVGFDELSNFFEDPYAKIVEMFSQIADTMLKLDKSSGEGFNKLGVGLDAIFTQVERVSAIKGRMYSVMLFEKFVNSVERLTKYKSDIKDLSSGFGELGSSMGGIFDPIDANMSTTNTPTSLTPTITSNTEFSTPPLPSDGNTPPKPSAPKTSPSGGSKSSDAQMIEMMQQMIQSMVQQMGTMNKNIQAVAKSNQGILSRLNSGIKTKDANF